MLEHPLTTGVPAARHVRPGPCSVTFRALPAAEVVDLAANAGLAGGMGSANASPDDRATTVQELQQAGDVAAAAGAEIAPELHRGASTDTVTSTTRLLEEVGRDNLSTHWQPPVDDVEAAAGPDVLLPQVSTLHVFSCGPAGEQLPPAARAVLWQQVLTTAQTAPACTDSLLEVVA